MTTHRLRDVALVLTSNVDKVIDPDEHPVRLCNYVDVYKSNFINNDMPFNRGSASAAEIKKFRVQVDDVIITKDSETADDIGVPALVRSTGYDLVCGYHLSILRADRRRMIGPFLYWHLLSKQSREDFRNAANGVTRYGLTLGGIKGIPVNVPDLATQRQIADFLDRETARIDLLIEKKQRFIETLSESRLTAAPSVIRAFGGPEMKESPDTFDIHFDASGWSVGRVKHVVRLMTSGSRGWSDLIQDDGELFLQSGNIGRHNEIVLSEAKRIIPQTNAEARRTRLKDADTLVCITGGRTGAVGFLETVPETAYVNQHICLLRPEPKKIYPKLLAQSLYSEIGQRQFSFFQYGLKQGLGFSQVGEIRLPIPPQDLQRKISSEIDRIFERIGSTQSLQERSIDRLKEYRSALITAAVTGQIDVSTYTKSGTPDRRLDAIQEEMDA